MSRITGPTGPKVITASDTLKPRLSEVPDRAEIFVTGVAVIGPVPEPESPIRIAGDALTAKLLELHRNPDDLRRLERRFFEELVAELFDGFGFQVELTAKTRDGGRDVIAIGQRDDTRTKYLIECKRPEPGNPVGVGYVRELFGVVEDEEATKGLLVATTYFTRDARDFEERHKWRLELKEYEHIVDWIARYMQIKRS